ncbi:et translation product-related [Anaeramoeba flamelloides]|uniref:UNC93-like protein MFSD11 n=1 Tax=Anaeramoeba flamelloides TaxID=1746091 RepID=A0ABQ8Y4F7_9EUKA|nr:et translation product-related [Anaeramoeba flamelloides]
MNKQRKQNLQTLLFSFSFCIFFIGFFSAQALTTKVSKKIGFFALTLLYSTFTFFLLISPWICKNIGPKYSIVFGGLFYLIFVSSYIKLITWYYLLASALVGFGAALLWCGNGVYLIWISPSEKIGKNTGIFNTFYLSSVLIGNGITSLLYNHYNLSDETVFTVLLLISAVGQIIFFFLDNIKSSQQGDEEPTETGKILGNNHKKPSYNTNTNTNNESSDTSRHNEEESLLDEDNYNENTKLINGEKEKIKERGVGGEEEKGELNLNRGNLSPKKSNRTQNIADPDSQFEEEKYPTPDERNNKGSDPERKEMSLLDTLKEQFRSLFKIFFSFRSLFFIPILVLVGMIQSIVYALLPSTLLKKNVPNCMIAFGITNFIGSFLNGLLIDKLGIFLDNILSTIVATIGCIVWISKGDSENLILVFTTFLCFGFSDSANQTLAYSIIKLLYPKKLHEGVVFAKFVNNGISAIFFFLFAYLSQAIGIYIFLGWNILAFISAFMIKFKYSN